MPSTMALARPPSIAALCLLVALAGCGGAPPAADPTDTATATQTATETPRQTTTPTDTEIRPTPTPTASRGGLLVVEVVDAGTTDPEAVRYDRTVFDRSPTLDDAVAEAVSTNETQRRDLSGQEIERIEAVADAYGRSIGDLAVARDDTVVRVSIAYEV
jgi:hypothetical protein